MLTGDLKRSKIRKISQYRYIIQKLYLMLDQSSKRFAIEQKTQTKANDGK